MLRAAHELRPCGISSASIAASAAGWIGSTAVADDQAPAPRSTGGRRDGGAILPKMIPCIVAAIGRRLLVEGVEPDADPERHQSARDRPGQRPQPWRR